MSIGTLFARGARSLGLVDSPRTAPYAMELSDVELEQVIDDLIPLMRSDDIARREAQMLVAELGWRRGADLGMLGAIDASADVIQGAYVGVKEGIADVASTVAKPIIVVGLAVAAYFVYKTKK